MACFDTAHFATTVSGDLDSLTQVSYRRVASYSVPAVRMNITDTPSTVLQTLDITWANPYPTTMRVFPHLTIGTRKMALTGDHSFSVQSRHGHTINGTPPVVSNQGQSIMGGVIMGLVPAGSEFAGTTAFHVVEINEPSRTLALHDNTLVIAPAGSYRFTATELLVKIQWITPLTHSSFNDEVENWVEAFPLKLDLYACSV